MTLFTGNAMRLNLVFLFLSAAAVVGTAGVARADTQTHYKTPQDAVNSIVSALRKNDVKALQAALGPEGNEIIQSGDPVQDKAGRERFLAAYDAKSKIVDKGPAKS